jgi:hypothetical protein
MQVSEIKKITERSRFEPFCISLESILDKMEDQARMGNSNCLLSIPEEKLNDFTNKLENLGYDFWWWKCSDPHLSSKYPDFDGKFIALEVAWF